MATGVEGGDDDSALVVDEDEDTCRYELEGFRRSTSAPSTKVLYSSSNNCDRRQQCREIGDCFCHKQVAVLHGVLFLTTQA